MNYNCDNIYLFVNEKEIYKFKADNKNVHFPSEICLRSICNKFEFVESEEVSFNGNVYDFLVDYDAIDKSDTLNIHKYSMHKNNIK